nr:atherin-like [Pelodiscus sinensis]|eukprot:XP_025033808.1 atherin-like [Pelodiscus sinensis]
MHSTKRRNADTFARMAEELAKQGHRPRTLEQVRAKVKELRQGYVWAHEQSSRSGERPHSCEYYEDLDRVLGASDPLPPERLVESGLDTPVLQRPEHLLGDQELQEEEEEEEVGTQRTQEPGTQTQEASQTTLDTGEETSAGPAYQEGDAPPAPPPRRPQGTRRHWRSYLELVRQHVGVLQEMKDSTERRLKTEAEWYRQLLLEFAQQRRDICAAIREAMAFPGPLPVPAPPPQPAPSSTLAPSSAPAIPAPAPAPPPAQPPSVASRTRSRVRQGRQSQSSRSLASRMPPQP